MGVNLSIKNVPTEKVELLKQRARSNHRSLQGELLALIDLAVIPQQRASDELAENGRKLGLATPPESVRMIREDRGTLTIDEAVAKIRKLGLTRHNEAVRMIREDRDR